MHPISTLKLAGFSVAAMAMFAAAGAAAAAADYYLKLGDIKGEVAAKAGSGKHIEIMSWSWGPTMAGNWDGTINSATSTAKFGTVGGMHRDESVNADGRTEAAMVAPLDRGAVRVKVRFPWLECKVGAAFPDAVLQNEAGRYELQEVIISGCTPDGVALNYAKVTVRGWDPVKGSRR
jgi:hypothetical protein